MTEVTFLSSIHPNIRQKSKEVWSWVSKVLLPPPDDVSYFCLGAPRCPQMYSSKDLAFNSARLQSKQLIVAHSIPGGSPRCSKDDLDELAAPQTWTWLWSDLWSKSTDPLRLRHKKLQKNVSSSWRHFFALFNILFTFILISALYSCVFEQLLWQKADLHYQIESV